MTFAAKTTASGLIALLVPVPFLVVLVFWLSIIFASLGCSLREMAP